MNDDAPEQSEKKAAAADASRGVALSTALPAYLADRYRAWRGGRYADNATWYARLASDGQRPRAMIISCCDSRLDTVAMFGAEPGDLFVVRNVANLVPPYTPDHNHHGTSAAIEYAVRNLKVAHLVVVGHSNCGGVQACHDMCAGHAPELESDSFVGRWMDILRPAYDQVIAEGGPAAERVGRLEKQAVRHSLDNLAGFPFVAEAVEQGLLSLHGAWVDIGKGALWTLDRATNSFNPV